MDQQTGCKIRWNVFRFRQQEITSSQMFPGCNSTIWGSWWCDRTPLKSGAKRKNHLFLHRVAPSVCETMPTAERWTAVCVEGLEPSHDRTSSRSRFVNLLKSERAAFVFVSTSRPLPPLREDYGALKWPSNSECGSGPGSWADWLSGN